MKLFLLLFLLGGCTTARFYQGPAVTQELKKNATSLEIVVASMESDYQEKEKFLNHFRTNGKDRFIMENLNAKLSELKARRDVLVKRTSHIRSLNQELLEKVEDKNKIKEGDPAFRAIENFAEKKDRELGTLLKDFASYKKASQEFEKLAFFTRMVKR